MHCRIIWKALVKRIMYNSRKKSVILYAAIFVFFGMWMMLSIHGLAVETNDNENPLQTVEQDESTQQKIVRVGSFEDTFDYVDKNGVRRGYGYELMQALAG